MRRYKTFVAAVAAAGGPGEAAKIIECNPEYIRQLMDPNRAAKKPKKSLSVPMMFKIEQRLGVQISYWREAYRHLFEPKAS